MATKKTTTTKAAAAATEATTEATTTATTEVTATAKDVVTCRVRVKALKVGKATLGRGATFKCEATKAAALVKAEQVTIEVATKK